MSMAFCKVLRFLSALTVAALSVALSGGACLPDLFSAGAVAILQGAPYAGSGYPLRLYAPLLPV